MLDDPDVRAALAQIRPRGRQAYAAIVHEAIGSATAANRLQPLYDQLDSAKPDNIFNSAAEFVSWLHFLTQSEQGIVDVMFSTYPDVEVFAHHMMDLEHYYHPGSCRYEYVSEQIGRMKKLVDKNKGRLVTFVAWSPKRDHDINVVRRALEDGVAVGVKFYPPSGYRADDPLHDSLYDLCGARWPIFSHCTPSGFEAYGKSGLNSDPKYWANVLAHRPDLRLCLAHAGGEEPWFGQKPWVGSFAQTAVDLAVNKANVYLEFGYHDYVLDPKRRAKFALTLITLLEQHGDSLGKKIVYGTDWHMIEKIAGHEQYFADFDQLFSSDPTLAKYKDDFFYNNGVRFMNLPNFLDTRASARHSRSRAGTSNAQRTSASAEPS